MCRKKSGFRISYPKKDNELKQGSVAWHQIKLPLMRYLLWGVDIETKFLSPLLYFLIALIFCVSVLFVPSSVFPFFYILRNGFSPPVTVIHFSPVFLNFCLFFFIRTSVISRLEVLPIFPFISMNYQEPTLCNFL